MKLVSFLGVHGEARTGAVAGARVIDLSQAVAEVALPEASVTWLARRGITPPAGGMLRLLWGGADALGAITRRLDAIDAEGGSLLGLALSDVELLAPIPRPGKILAVGRNYADHARETGVGPFENPRIIAKLASSVVGPGAVLAVPAAVKKLDLEAELGVVIGSLCRGVTRAGAREAIAGYTVLNDLSAREFQFDVSPPQTTFAKSMDGFCPMGPWLVTRDEVPDPQALAIRSFINDTPMQAGNTANMLFPIDRIIEYLSQFMTLEPGDVIATGTPAGIGAFRDPPIWLGPRDRVRIEIAGIGVLEHSIGEPRA